MHSVPARYDLTLWLENLLTGHGLTVGLIVAPEAGGWDDDPNIAPHRFQEYVVLTPMLTPEPQGSMGDPSFDWVLPYAVSYTGVMLAQVEGQGDKVRRILSEVRPQGVTLGGEQWKVASARVTSLGGVNIDRDPNPDELNVRDTVEVRVSKEL